MSILSLPDWLETPLGNYLLEWEQAKFDLMVSNLFGYNALQLGPIKADFLRANRIPFRFRCTTHLPADVIAHEEHLPFATNSLDLVLLPHVLEFSSNPHQVLRDVERILLPEGNVIIAGFNPFSLWGLRRLSAREKKSMPWQGQYLSISRIKDWLKLLNFEPQAGSFGCYSPPFTNPHWLERSRFMDKAGNRWWPICGGTYILQAVKRVPAMHLITPNWRDRPASAKALLPTTSQKNPLPSSDIHSKKIINGTR